ncbi:hypothetical protein CJ214_06155 [Peptoniphilus lacrimalis]|nr:hypothetical protein CJ214_06155 [Peptoniphilus lacrimalis]
MTVNIKSHKLRQALGNSEARVSSLWSLRSTMQKIVTRHTLRDCGHVINHAAAVQKIKSDGSGAFGGLATCSNVWCCPVCSAKISHYRVEQIKLLVDWAKRNNYVISLLTLTQRHHRGDKLKHLWESISHAFSKVQQSSGFHSFREDLLVGYVKATEVTYGDNGWHVHFHILFITTRTFEGYHCNKRGDSIRDYIAQTFKRHLAKNGVDFIADSGGMDWQICKDGTERIVAKYVSKVHGDIAKELTLGNFKKARVKSSRTPFQILADIQADNFENKQDIAIFNEFVSASRYRAFTVFSRDLFDMLPLEDLDDEQILEQRSDRDTLFFISKDDWEVIREDGTAPQLLAFVESTDDVRDIIGYCRRWLSSR